MFFFIYRYDDEEDKFNSPCIKNGAKKAIWKCVPKSKFSLGYIWSNFYSNFLDNISGNRRGIIYIPTGEPLKIIKNQILSLSAHYHSNILSSKFIQQFWDNNWDGQND